jgi:hypothetical protein
MVRVQGDLRSDQTFLIFHSFHQNCLKGASKSLLVADGRGSLLVADGRG